MLVNLRNLWKKKRNEQNVKRIRALFKNSDIGIDVRAEDALDTAYSTYTTIISKKCNEKTLQLLADYLKLSSFKELVAEDNSMIEREEEREDVISNVTEHMEGLDPKIVNMLSEFSEQLYPIDKLKSFTDEHSIAYMRVGYENIWLIYRFQQNGEVFCKTRSQNLCYQYRFKKEFGR